MSDKFQVIRENAPMVTYVGVDSGSKGWDMRLILYPNAELNDITFNKKGCIATYKLDQHRVIKFKARGGFDMAFRSDEDGWDRITKGVPNTVLTQALEWASELKEFAKSTSLELRS